MAPTPGTDPDVTASSVIERDAQESAFFRILPGEMRNRIYREVLVQDFDLDLTPLHMDNPNDLATIRNDASQIFWAENTLFLEPQYVVDERFMVKAIEQAEQANASSISYLEIRTHSYSYYLKDREDTITDVIDRLIACGVPPRSIHVKIEHSCRQPYPETDENKFCQVGSHEVTLIDHWLVL